MNQTNVECFDQKQPPVRGDFSAYRGLCCFLKPPFLPVEVPRKKRSLQGWSEGSSEQQPPENRKIGKRPFGQQIVRLHAAGQGMQAESICAFSAACRSYPLPGLMQATAFAGGDDDHTEKRMYQMYHAYIGKKQKIRSAPDPF